MVYALALPSIDWLDCEWADPGKMNQTWLDIVDIGAISAASAVQRH